MENKKKQRKIVRSAVVSLLLLLLVVLVILVLVMSRDDLSMNGILHTLTAFGRREQQAERFDYTSSTDSVFAALDGGLAIVSKTGVQVFNAAGDETVSDPIGFDSPAISERGGRAVAYDVGGDVVRVFDEDRMLLELDADSPVISAALNESGWLTVAAQEAAYHASVTVYNADGTAVYKWYSGNGYVLDAEVSPDNSGLAALVLTDSGSAVTFFKLNSEEEQSRFVLDDTVILDIRYMEKDTISLITDKGLYLISSTGEQRAFVDYSGRTLVGWNTAGDGFILLAVSDYQMSTACSLMTVSYTGEVIATLQSAGRPAFLSAAGGYAAVMNSDSIKIYDSTLTEAGAFTEISALNAALVRKDGSIIAAGTYSASVLKIK